MRVAAGVSAGTRRAASRCTLVSIAVVESLWAAATPVAATTTHRGPARPVVQHGHAKFGDCPARSIAMTVTLRNPVATLGTPVHVEAVVRNLAATRCHYTHAGPIPDHGPARPATMGECGSMPLVVYRPEHHQIWPGDVPVFCPLLVSATFAPHSTVVVHGQWDQELGPNSGLPAALPTGKYWVVVDGRFRFTVRIT